MPLSLAYLSERMERERIAPNCARIAPNCAIAAPELRGARLGLLGLDLPLRVEVRLVAGERDHDVRVALPLQLLHPLLRALERVPVRDVVHHDGGGGAAVVHRRERVVPLLPRRVPDLELDGGVVERDRLRQERRADRGLLVLEELPAHEAQHERRLADRAVAEQHQLELEDAAGRRHGANLTNCAARRGRVSRLHYWNQRPPDAPQRYWTRTRLPPFPSTPSSSAHAPPAEHGRHGRRADDGQRPPHDKLEPLTLPCAEVPGVAILNFSSRSPP